MIKKIIVSVQLENINKEISLKQAFVFLVLALFEA